MFIHESILRPIVKFTTDEAIRCINADFFLTLDELESFIALQYVRDVYGKNCLIAFLWSKNYMELLFLVRQCSETSLQKY